jgi:hypothetical protein
MIDNKLKKYMKNERPSKKNKIEILNSKKNEIIILRNAGYGLQQIVNYLKSTHQIITSRQTIGDFLSKDKK